MRPKTRVRWWIIGTLFLSTTVNYIDRQTLSVLSPVILKELNLSHVDYSKIVSAFQVTYAVTWLVAAVFTAKVPLSAVFIGLFLSTAVGLFFGIYPASKAARLDPVVALRAE